VIESASGLSYCEYLRSRVFEPLDIGRHGIDCLIAEGSDMARGYYKHWSIDSIPSHRLAEKPALAEAGWGRLRRVYMNGPAYGGLFGTARGFGRFVGDQLGAKSILFSADIKRLHYSGQFNNRGASIPMTLGWRRGRLLDSEYFGKPGGGPGFQSNVRIYPEHRIATIMFANRLGFMESAINGLTDSFDRLLLESTKAQARP
jgi:CubicO group peptidase (beta-lactamase class C family)